MWRKLGRRVINNFILLGFGAVLGFAALLLVHCLPVENMQLHVQQSLPMIEKEFEDSVVVEGYAGTLTGMFTDCLMLEHAVYKNKAHSLMEQTLYMYRGESFDGDGWAPGYSLRDYLRAVPQAREVEYARYWHGYLVILKPLLMIISFNAIRMTAAIVQLILLGGLIINYCGENNKILGQALLVSVPFLYFLSLYFSLSLSLCFYLLAVILLIQQKLHGKLAEKGLYCEFFLLAGMATSYFDFFTYPLVTLGFPLAVALYREHDGWRKALGRLAGYSAEWGIGYIGLWAWKWILTDLLAGGSVIKDAVQTIWVRTGAAEEKSFVSGFFYVLQLNAGAYANWPYGLLGLGIAAWLLYMIWKSRKKQKSDRWKEAIVIGMVALLPFGWFLITQNHSEQHWMYTCKIFSISIFALVCAVAKWLGAGEQGDG